jgi:hypothetical protein
VWSRFNAPGYQSGTKPLTQAGRHGNGICVTDELRMPPNPLCPSTSSSDRIHQEDFHLLLPDFFETWKTKLKHLNKYKVGNFENRTLAYLYNRKYAQH